MDSSKNGFRTVKNISSAIAVSTTALPQAINGYGCTVTSLAGNLWINPNGTAAADATSIKLLPGASMDLFVHGNLSII